MDDFKMDDFQKRVVEKLDKLDNKIDTLHDRIHSIDLTLAVQAASLQIHIHRTELAEENIALLRADVVPIQKVVVVIETIFKFIGFIAVLVSIAAGLVKIFG
jgi:hypothetical protein